MPQIDLIQKTITDPQLATLITDAPMCGLDDGPRSSSTSAAIQSWLSSGDAKGTLVESALWLLAGELDRSHTISQDFGSPEGSFWHGIMHRREGDFGNSKYWFRRVGGHHVHEELARLLDSRKSEFASDLPWSQLTDSQDLPFTLVDCCQAVSEGNSTWSDSLSKICWWEWQLLFAASQV